MEETVQRLIDDLVTLEEAGTSVVVLVGDYRERADLARELTDEARLFGIDLVSLSNVEETQSKLPTLDAARDQALLLLIDPDDAAAFGQWLDAARESLPRAARFVIVLMFKQDLPVLARGAPSFMSWAKALEIPRLVDDSGETPSEIAEEMRRLEEETGKTPAEFVAAWGRGEIPDTHRNTVWLNLACAVTGQGSE